MQNHLESRLSVPKEYPQGPLCTSWEATPSPPKKISTYGLIYHFLFLLSCLLFLSVNSPNKSRVPEMTTVPSAVNNPQQFSPHALSGDSSSLGKCLLLLFKDFSILHFPQGSEGESVGVHPSTLPSQQFPQQAKPPRIWLLRLHRKCPGVEDGDQ